jgi:hypothetical protein
MAGTPETNKEAYERYLNICQFTEQALDELHRCLKESSKKLTKEEQKEIQDKVDLQYDLGGELPDFRALLFKFLEDEYDD